MADQWAEFQDAPASGDPWGEFRDAPANVPNVPIVQRKPTVPIVLRPTGAAHDGDTFGVTGGGNARLYGVDAFELNQTGRNRAGQSVPLGIRARDYLRTSIGPDSLITPTGKQSYNRPVVSLSRGGMDTGRSVLEKGYGLAAPDYLKSSPLLPTYMEAERQARLNRRGAHATQFQSPTDYRHKVPDPWAKAEASTDGKGAAMFFDDRTPFQGLRPGIAEGYIAVAQDPKSTAADLMRYAKANGFQIDPKVADKFIRHRSQPGARVSDQVQYEALPQVLTNQGDGRLGAFGRGVADPINMLDEMGGVVDTLGGTDGRESIFNSDRRFGDILWNNIGQNRSVLGYDDANHPYARFGGQLAGGLVAPGASIEGVGFNAARAAIRGGASRFAAAKVAQEAVRRRLMTAGAVEGGLAGYGAGEGGPIERAPSAAIGAAIGAGFGYGTAALGQKALPLVRRVAGRPGRYRKSDIDPAASTASTAGDEWGEFADAVPAERNEIVLQNANQFGRAAMDSESTPASISAPARVPDRIDVWAEFADAPSGALDDPALGRVRPLMGQATPEQMAATANRVFPEGMVPMPRNEIESLDEAMRANPGSVRSLPAPDERAALTPYKPAPNLPARRDPMDLVSFLRSQGGIRDQGGELSHMGVGNKPRDVEFAKSEGFLGPLVSDAGRNLDDAAQAAWERGYFPDHAERPTVSEFLDAIGNTHRGGAGRVFHPDDYTAIDAYRGAQAQRHAVEQAEAAGSPLAERMGQPATLDHLDANQPPATAYEDLPRTGGRAGNIVLDQLESKEDIQRALLNTDAVVGGFDAARRGRVSHAETEALARELNMTADDLLRRRKGQALNAEQALAARSILAKSGDELVGMARKAAGGSDEDIASFRRAWLRHVAIQEQVSGATAEAGRALSQFRMAASSKLPRGRVLKEMLDSAGGRDDLENAAKAIIELQKVSNDPAKVNEFAAKALKPRFKDKLVELWYNSLLSGPQTHAVNILSNSMTAALQLPEHAAASAIGAARRAFGEGEIDRVMGSEIGARAVGLMQGTREGLRAFARTVRTGQAVDPLTKIESAEREAISGLKGKIIRTPARFLSAEDELFKAIGRRMELNGLAVREASKEGLKGDAFQKRVADLSANPTDEMLERSFDYARYVTFQRPLGSVGTKLLGITGDWPILKLFVPFIRTPSNIFKYVLERSPAAPVIKEWRSDFAAGGARRDLALAKMALGTGLGMVITDLAAQGHVTGSGPADDGAKELMRADGWQPYSIRIGDKYYSYQRLDPIASTLGVAADLAGTSEYMTEKQREKSAALITAAVIKNLSNKTWLSGITSVTDAIDDPDRSAKGLIARIAGSMAIPAGLAQITRTIDPILREAREPIDAIKARVPIVSKTLPARTNVWGRPIVNEGGLGPNITSPVWTSTRRNDAVNNALLRSGIGVGVPGRPKVDGKPVSDDQFREYKNVAGQMTYEALQPYLESPSWQTLGPDQQEDLIDRLKRDARKEAKRGMFGGSR